MSSAGACRSRNIYGDSILFRMVRHEDSVELIVEREGYLDAESAAVCSTAVLVTGFALSYLLTEQVSRARALTSSLSASFILRSTCRAT